MVKRPKDLHTGFMSRVCQGAPDACWPWTGKKHSRGYGYFRGMRVHRIAWEIENGCKIPEGLIILHSCDNPICVNPAHLKCGTQKDNIRDGIMKGRINRREFNPRLPFCGKGHELTESNTITKLRKDGIVHRTCRSCQNESNKQYRIRRKDYES
jgi:hypothetical protein